MKQQKQSETAIILLQKYLVYDEYRTMKHSFSTHSEALLQQILFFLLEQFHTELKIPFDLHIFAWETKTFFSARQQSQANIFSAPVKLSQFLEFLRNSTILRLLSQSKKCTKKGAFELSVQCTSYGNQSQCVIGFGRLRFFFFVQHASSVKRSFFQLDGRQEKS